MQKLKIILFSILICALFLSACSIKVDDDASSEHLMSREYVAEWCKTSNFGWSSDSIPYIALNYLYNDEELKEKYGETFVADDIGGTADWDFRLFDLYSGKATYVVTIKDDRWIVELSKEFSNKWEITNCYYDE